jgi:undecaprenyl-phosphate 4-deoxy-4-formamido-L-arabinose transferase
LLGIREAKFETIVTIDDDLQNPPEEISLLLNRLRAEGADVVYGVPRQKQHGFVQNFGSRVVRYGLAIVLGAEHARDVTSFRAFRTVRRESFSWHQSPRVSIDALLGWGATKYSKVIVDHQPRQHGASGYNFRKLVVHALTMVTSYSTMPLRIATLTGFSLVLVGAVVSGYVIVGRLIGFVTEPGFASLVSLFAIIGGAQLLALGVIGEYLATIFMRSLGMPAYTLAEKTESAD